MEGGREVGKEGDKTEWLVVAHSYIGSCLPHTLGLETTPGVPTDSCMGEGVREMEGDWRGRGRMGKKFTQTTVYIHISSSPLPSLFSQVIHGAVTGNREQIIEASRNMGFLSGYESKVHACGVRGREEGMADNV